MAAATTVVCDDVWVRIMASGLLLVVDVVVDGGDKKKGKMWKGGDQRKGVREEAVTAITQLFETEIDTQSRFRFIIVIRVVVSTQKLASLIHRRSGAATFNSSSLIESSSRFITGSSSQEP
ncbi:hypothetical protein LOK49_LG05G01267 [Camellia lanceoleosa]|uniref:Uncharacterized protein n=1 Tax=Camellia lanceoleosa TaxID=1840588 RepID=A0ACC0HMW6_9ERIC|nr:hypothetical protein LOK49_LG05G01267 [Camellia lanceoleosa]